MRRKPTHAGDGRIGFTMIEVVIVIAVMLILTGLLLAGVMRALGTQNVAQTRYDINELKIACGEFKAKFGVFPPSQILLTNDPAKYQSHPLGPISWIYLRQIWPKLDPDKAYDWANGSMSGTYEAVLEGDQCLVFFLGGIQSHGPDGCLGFGEGISDPTDRRGKKRVVPFFKFEAKRLFQRSASHTFFSYQDGFGEKIPYAYFRSTGGKLGAYSKDCPTLGVEPYYEKTATFFKYLNPESFQIISAGANSQFGPGGQYNPDLVNVPAAGKDDLSNFHPEFLGTPR